MKRIHSLFYCCLLLVPLGGCFSLGKRSDPSHYYVLREEMATGKAIGGAVSFPRGIVVLDRVRIPEYMRRQQIVSREESGKLNIHDGLRWGEPLDVGITAVLRDYLTHYMPQCLTLSAPWTGDMQPNWTVRLVIDELSLGPRNVHLVAHYSIDDFVGGIPVVMRTFQGSAVVERSTVEDTLCSTRQLLQRLAEHITAGLREVQESDDPAANPPTKKFAAPIAEMPLKEIIAEMKPPVEEKNQRQCAPLPAEVLLEARSALYVIVDDVRTGQRILSQKLAPQQKLTLPHAASALKIISSMPGALLVNGVRVD
ncbi:MAG: PqiC family protein [Puniceicoccales bacterium]|jgi:uncharacterized lipoprotein YmbA|nr:PqiC family protein [Puniceicoccales bacterium]